MLLLMLMLLLLLLLRTCMHAACLRVRVHSCWLVVLVLVRCWSALVLVLVMAHIHTHTRTHTPRAHPAFSPPPVGRDEGKGDDTTEKHVCSGRALRKIREISPATCRSVPCSVGPPRMGKSLFWNSGMEG